MLISAAYQATMQSVSLLSPESLLPTLSSSTSILAQETLSNNNAFTEILGHLEFSQHPIATTILSYCLVTTADMVPFVPCQPLAIALGAQLGFGVAFPITTLGQATAGILAFSAARKAADTEFAKSMTTSKLSPQALEKLEDFRSLTAAGEGEQGDGRILLALIGLRLAPFFPFSAGNYLLGGTTSVPLRLFVIATLIGCIGSNFLSVTVGAGGALLFLSSNDGLLIL